MPKPQRHPSLTMASATSGTPITLENFAAASKIDVANARSLRGNQYPVAFELAGKPGASATPNRMRAPKILPKPPAKAVKVEKSDQKNVLTRLTLVTPKRSRI